MGILLEETYKANVSSLKTLCTDAIVKTIRKPLITKSTLEKELYPIRRNIMMNELSNVVLPSNLAELLIEEFSKNDSLHGDILSIFTLNADYNNINVLKLHKFNTDNEDDLSKFNSFQLKKLHLTPTTLNNWNVDKLIASFQGSRESLTSLKLNFHAGQTVASGDIFDFICKYPNLTSLYYTSLAKDSHTIFTNENWERLVASCPKLHTIYVNLNVSFVDKYEIDSSIFRDLSNLQRLTLRNIFKSSTPLKNSNSLSHFTMIDTLRHLDISIDTSPSDFNRPFNTDNENGHDLYMRTHSGVLASYVNCFLKMALGKLPALEYLDLSGIFLLEQDYIENFIIDHQNLNFLGLCMVRSKLCTDETIVRRFPGIKITGCVLEDQIITSLLAYPDRVKYMREVLKGLFQISSSWKSRKPLIVKIVLDIMERFKEHEDIQWVATACIYQLCRDDENITVELSNDIVNEIGKMVTITMIQHIGNIHIVKNCLLILSSEVILYNATYNRAFTAWICLGCMATYPESIDRYVTQMAVTIIAVLAVEMSPKERASMLQERDMLLFLHIIQQRLDTGMIDGTLRWLLEVVWSFTDNSPQLIELFTKLGGLQKYMDLLDTFSDDLHIQTDVLGLLFNIAEMLTLDKELIMRIKVMTSSNHIPASYFACGVLANFSLRWDTVNNDLSVDEKRGILGDIQSAIDRFGVREEKIVNYKTFKPIYSLLESHQKAEIQHWAVWTIHHLCTVDTNNYRKLMNKTCYDLLQDIRCRTSSVIVREQINGILEALDIEDLYEKEEL